MVGARRCARARRPGDGRFSRHLGSRAFRLCAGKSSLVDARQNVRPFDRLRVPLYRRRRSGPGAIASHMRWPAFWRRFALIVAAAALVTAGTYVAFPTSYVFFGILHCIAVASLIAVPFLFAPWPVALAGGAFFLRRRGVLRVVRLQRRLAAMDRTFDQRADDRGLASALSLGGRAAARRRGGKTRSPRLRGESRGERRGR